MPTEPPKLYAEKLAPLLTPLETVLKLPLTLSEDHPSGAVLLDENIQYVETDGRRLRVLQVAYKALTEAGVEELASDIFSYRKKEQKLYLVRAETIQPDGTVQPVRPEATLLQSPQRQAQYALYDDQAEVRVIYPNVKPGSVTHAIIVFEDLSAKMPGEFTQTYVWTRPWPVGRVHYIADLPAMMAGRLQINSIGSDVPSPERVSLPDGRLRLAWTLDRLPPGRSEPYPAPLNQSGPAIHLTTLNDWAQIGRWFNALAKGHDELKPALAAKVDGWTKDAKSRDDIVRILYEHVANDVRYTGLELGAADYQPHDCNEVWDNQYGDCKDKATLLAALLRHKGLPANIVLLNTDQAGLVDRRSPDFRVFTHAIVALPDGRGGWEFCDPTMEQARPGMLSPTDSDRDVLVVTTNGAEWAHTPAQAAGRMAYAFELKLNQTGELSGWLTLTCEGYYSTSERARFIKLNPDETRDTMTRTVRGFYAGAQVVDVVKPDVSAADTYVIKAYFIVNQQHPGGNVASTLVFPQSPSLFYDVGHAPERHSSYFLWMEHTSISATVNLPAGIAPAQLPEPYRLSSPACDATAQWQFADGTCRMSLELGVARSVLTPAEFPVFYNANQSLQAWLAKPVLLAADSKRAITPAAAPDDIDLPLMPSGQGELNLVDQRYPVEGNHAVRRAALEKTLQYFPTDKATVFIAQACLAYLDWSEDKNQAAVDRLAPLLAGYKADVTPGTYAWGEGISALALKDAGHEDEALAIFRRNAAAPGLSDDRHARSALQAADLLRKKSPAEALALLTAAAPLSTDSRPGIFALLARLLLQQDGAVELRTHLTGLKTGQPQDFEPVLVYLVQQSSQWNEPGEDAKQEALLALLTNLVPSPGKDLEAALAEAKSGQRIALASKQIQARLKELLANQPLAAWYVPPQDPTLKSRADFDRAIKAAIDKTDSERCLQLAVLGLVTFPPAADFPHRLWQAMTDADWREELAGRALDEPILLDLLDLCDQLPPDTDDFYDGRCFRAIHLGRKKDYAGQQAILQTLLADPKLPSGFFQNVYGRLGDSLQLGGDYAGALKNYRAVEKYANTSPDSADRMLQAVLINLSLEQPDEALRIIGLLAKVDESILKQTKDEGQIREFIALAASGHAAEFWTARKSWWPLWEALAQELALPTPGLETIAPVSAAPAALEQQLGELARAPNHTDFYQTFRRLLSAARWLPSYGPGLAALNNDPLILLNSDQCTAYRHMLIAMLETKVPEPSESTLRRLTSLAATYLGNGQPDDVLRVAASFRALNPPDGILTRWMNRIRGIAARGGKKELAESAAALAHDLADPTLSFQRAYTVGLLADLYHLLGQPTDEETLLRRELTHPVITGDHDDQEKISARLDALTGPTRFAKQVAAWLTAHKPGWYDFAEPTSLADPRLRDLDAVLKAPEAQFRAVEAIKLRLLVAQDPAQSSENQRAAWREAIRGLLSFSPTQVEARAVVASVLGDTSFDDDTQVSILWVALWDDYLVRDRAGFAELCKQPAFAKFTSDERDRMNVLVDYMATSRTAKDALVSLTQKLSAKPLNGMAVEVMQAVMDDLLQLGDIAAARDVAAQAATWQLAPDVATPRQTLQLNFAREIRAGESMLPTQQALLHRIEQAFPSLPAEPPAEFAALHSHFLVPAFAPDLKLQTCLWMIKARQFNYSNLSFWVELSNTLHAKADYRALADDLAAIAIEQAGDDSQRSEAVLYCMTALDLDDPSARAFLEPLFAKIRQPVDAPLTTAAIRLYEIQLARRTGQPIDLNQAFANLQFPGVASARTYAMLQQALQTQDRSTLKLLTDTLPPDQLLQPNMLRLTIPAYDLLGLKDESQLARETARHELHELVLQSWVNYPSSTLAAACHLAEAINEAGQLPAEWVKFISEHDPYPSGRLQVLWLDAMQHKDWGAATGYAETLIKLYSNDYDYYWLKAQALWAGGRKTEAVEPLTTYIRFSKDEVDYPKAVGWLKELGKPVP